MKRRRVEIDLRGIITTVLSNEELVRLRWPSALWMTRFSDRQPMTVLRVRVVAPKKRRQQADD